MKKILCLMTFGLSVMSLQAQKSEVTRSILKEPVMVTPGKKNRPPSDAIVLYNGKQDLVNWVHREAGKSSERGEPVKWKAGKILTIVPKTGGIGTVRSFGDVQLHIEWRTPEKITGNGQARGNSGIFFMGEYELQVLDSWKNETYFNGQAGAIYKQYAPLVNASLPPGKWQMYDAFFIAPRFNEDKTLKSPAYITVIHNGILIQNHVEIKGSTYTKTTEYKFQAGKLPLELQDHWFPVSYRNIWIREL